MPDLLLHSMAEFGDLMVDVLRLAGAKTVVEIGAEGGESTRVLLEHTEKAGGELVVIDPAPSPAAEALIGRHRHARLVKQTSLEVLPSLAADAYLIDGDHNYYTVSRESTLIWEQCEAAGKPFLALYHDVCWPWARRDLYYDPSRIPPEHLKPHAWDRGVTLDQPRAIAGGFRGEGQWACAIEEGGPKNGVMTAIEEFVIGREHALAWACVPAVFGLGVLFDQRAPWAGAVADLLLPYHMNPLLARLERNRLECYLAVIQWQDRQHEKLHA